MAEATAPKSEKKVIKPQPKKRTGIVVSDSMNKTFVMTVRRLVKHPLYKKYLRRDKKLYVHDEKNVAKTGDTVEVAEVTRPLSKLKRWRLTRVVERAK